MAVLTVVATLLALVGAVAALVGSRAALMVLLVIALAFAFLYPDIDDPE